MIIKLPVKVIVVLATLSFCLALLTGCGSQPTTTQNPPQATTASAGSNNPNLDGFPPPIPHELEEREQCIVCHRDGEVGNAPKSPHPELTNCRQCHVTSK